MRNLLLLSLAALLVLTSCDAQVLYKLYLHNDSQQTMHVNYSFHGKDSILTIPAGEKAMLMEQMQLNSGVKPYFTVSKEINWLNSLSASLEDGSQHLGDLRLVERWKFEREGPVGLYNLRLGEGDFKK